jgi:hypothetical protein
MKHPLHTITALTLAILLVAPSVYMVQVGKVYGEIIKPEVAVEAFARTASDAIRDCMILPMITSAIQDWLPSINGGVIGIATETGLDRQAATEAARIESHADTATLYGNLIAVTVPTIDTISYRQKIMDLEQGGAILHSTQATAMATTDVSKETSSNTFKECVLDPLVNNIKEMLIDSITADLVSWIEGGFEGEPAFLTDPGAYFKDIGKAAVSAYLYDSGMDEFICEPFRVDVVLQFLWDYETPPQSQFGSLSCDLEDVFSEGIVLTVSEGNDPNTQITRDTRSTEERYRAMVEGGDFDAGGGLLGMSKSLEPGNNRHDQTIRTQAIAKAKLDQIEATEKETVAQGNGWLSQRCDTDGDGTKDEVCTPGHYVAGQVDQWMGNSLSQLELADEFGEILDALLKYVVTEILTSASGDYGLLHVRT